LKVQVADLEQFGSGLIGAVNRGVRPAELRVERSSGFEGRREASV